MYRHKGVHRGFFFNHNEPFTIKMSVGAYVKTIELKIIEGCLYINLAWEATFCDTKSWYSRYAGSNGGKSFLLGEKLPFLRPSRLQEDLHVLQT